MMLNKKRVDEALLAVTPTLPGCVAMVSDRRETIYAGSFGVRDAAASVPMTLDTVFSLASMTKAVVSVAALQLVDQGRLSLDDPVAGVLPELSAPQVLASFDADGTSRLRPALSAITLRQLLSHSAGYGYPGVNLELKTYLEGSGLPIVPESSQQLAKWPLLFDPGTRWNYGINTDIVGKTIEAVTGQRLDLQMRKGLLAQLGMNDSGFVVADEQRMRLSATQLRNADGSLTDLGFPFDRGVRWCMGGGGMHGTGSDYLRFIRMILNGGIHEERRVLSPAAIEAVLHNQLAAGVTVRRIISFDPTLAHDFEFFPGMAKHYSAAFMINTERASTGRNSGSLAWAGVVNTYCWIDPTVGIGGVFLAQLLPFYDPAAAGAFMRFEQAVYDELS